MKKYEGIHFYICILNYNEIILDEENQTGGVTRSIHALDTFFSSIERYGKNKFSSSFVVEKITGARLHLYAVDDVISAFEVVKSVSAYAYSLAKYINHEIDKYRLLKDFKINVGVAYGKFYDFEFIHGEYAETTTIGFAANLAAKLQALTGAGRIGISERVFDELPDSEKAMYERIEEESIKKYEQTCFYATGLYRIVPSIGVDLDLHEAKEYAYSANLKDIEIRSAKKLVDFNHLNRTHCVKMEGIPVFADVRDFTSKFEKDDTNLDEMAHKTQKILESMYMISSQHGGVHVQFQGDRELSLYHNIHADTYDNNIQEQTCFKAAVLASMRMIDAVKPLFVHIGVGEDFGKLFATKIGARGEKDNLILGETVIHADTMEDKFAGQDQIAITNAVYNGLKEKDAFLAKQFKQVGDYFLATIGYDEYQRSVSYLRQKDNTVHNKYNGAWGDRS